MNFILRCQRDVENLAVLWDNTDTNEAGGESVLLTKLSFGAKIKIGKIAIGGCLAILLAQLLGIHYAPSAGIITLLSIQDTKKATLAVAVKRGAAFLAAVAIAAVVFLTFGYHAVSFGLFLLVFVAVCMMAGLQDGISMCAVLVTHFLVERSVSFYWIRNESLLLVIGIGIGILLNLYMPRFTGEIREKQSKIETEIKLILKGIATYLIAPSGHFQLDYEIAELEQQITAALKQAYEDNENILRYEIRYYIRYMQMRKSQAAVLGHILKQTQELKLLPKQAAAAALFINEIIMSLRESNNAQKLLQGLTSLKELMKKEELPKSRDEFENRAVLYGLLNDLEQFLEIKRAFASQLTEEEKKEYWG